MTGRNVLGSNWGICFCSSEPCFGFASSGGHTLLSCSVFGTLCSICMQVGLLWEVTASAAHGCWRYVSAWEVTISAALRWLRYVPAPYLFCSPPPSFILLGFWVRNRFLYKPFSKTVFVGLKESTSLWVVIPVEVRLPTAGSPQTPRKRDPHWELLLLLSYS